MLRLWPRPDSTPLRFQHFNQIDRTEIRRAWIATATDTYWRRRGRIAVGPKNNGPEVMFMELRNLNASTARLLTVEETRIE